MAYLLDDGFDTWPETVQAGNAAVGLYVRCGAWIAHKIWTGNITEPVVPAGIAVIYGTQEWVRRLVDVGFWAAEGDGYRDVLYYRMGNAPAEKVRARRLSANRRQALVRDPALREAVRRRDKDRCRYCAVAVRWNDRKGGQGGTYDHVDPAGDNSLGNVVVACRSCNSSKKDRLPAEAGMVLLPPPGQPRSDLDTTQIRSESDPGSSRPHSPPKGGRGRAPAPPGAARPPNTVRTPPTDDNSPTPPPPNPYAERRASTPPPEARALLDALGPGPRDQPPPWRNALDELRATTTPPGDTP